MVCVRVEGVVAREGARQQGFRGMGHGARGKGKEARQADDTLACLAQG